MAPLKKKALFVSAFNLFGPNGGYFTFSRQVLEMLRGPLDIDVISFNGGIKGEESHRALDCRSLGGQRRTAQLLSLLKPSPSYFSEFDPVRMREGLALALRETRAEIIFLNGLRSAVALPDSLRIPGVRIVYLAHNHEFTSIATVARYSANLLYRFFAWFEARKIQRFERAFSDAADRIICLTEEDAARFRKDAANCRTVVVPPVFLPVDVDRSYDTSQSRTRFQIVGSFRWKVKADNVSWLIEKVLIPYRKSGRDITLRVIGANASKAFSRYAGIEWIQVLSDVPSVEPYLRDDTIAIVPERQEGGVKLKTLEAAAYGLAIVGTTAGIEGTHLKPGESCLRADTPEEFASAFDLLLGSQEKALHCASMARNVIRDRFNKEQVLSSLMKALQL